MSWQKLQLKFGVVLGLQAILQMLKISNKIQLQQLVNYEN